jgi:hypothetical protein
MLERPLRLPSGEALLEPWADADTLPEWLDAGTPVEVDPLQVTDELFASSAEDPEPAPFVGLADLLSEPGRTFGDADRLALEGEAALGGSTETDPNSEGASALASVGGLGVGLPRDDRNGRFNGQEFGAWMLYGERPNTDAFLTSDPRLEPLPGQITDIVEVPLTETEASVIQEPDPVARVVAESENATDETEAEAYPEDESALAAQTAARTAAEERARRFSVLRRGVDLAPNHYWGVEVPMHLLAGSEKIYTPNVGIVNVETHSGEVFVGRLASIGGPTVWLQANPGKLALKGSEVASIQRMEQGGVPWPSSWQVNPTVSGLPAVRVRVAGGFLEGRLFAHEGDRVTLITPEGGRITVRSDEVQPAGRGRAMSSIKGRLEELPQ